MEAEVRRILRDAKLLEIGAGATEIRKTIIARALLGWRQRTGMLAEQG